MSSVSSSKGCKEQEVEVDIFKETPLRYLGYTNEIGESLGPVYPRLVAPSYLVAFVYVGGDTLDKAYKSHRKGRPALETCNIAADTFIWQLFASVLIPGKVINIIANQSSALLRSPSFAKLPSSLRKWTPTMLGICTIPFIIHPIDNAVDYTMDHSIRKALSSNTDK